MCEEQVIYLTKSCRERQLSGIQLTEEDTESQNTGAKLGKIGQVYPEAIEVELMGIPVKTEAWTEEVLFVDAAGAETEPMDIDIKIEPEEAKPTGIKAAGPKSAKGKVVKTKRLATKKAKNKKAAAAAAKPKGAKPKGAKKRGGTTSAKRGKGGAKTSLEDTLAKTRKWTKAPTSYTIRNPETGCLGRSNRREEGTRPELTIVHTIDCACRDVRLMHVCQHVDALVKSGQLKRRARDLFVIAIKIRRKLAARPPRAMRFPPLQRQRIRRRKSDVLSDAAVINVVEVHNQQKLVETWKNLEAYKKRPIWKDW
ncbi:hypothetical protein ANO14919_067330 [Xylariales sp. No.14919]|nr:hypothetical protein ANO14919_067330 [Xylariales sp. No.14919]